MLLIPGFLLGGLVVYGLIYVFGFLWYLLNMFSVRMLSFASAGVITAILAAGLSLVVKPPQAVAGQPVERAGSGIKVQVSGVK